MDIQKLVEVGKNFDLSGKELQKYVEEKEAEERERQMRERKERDNLAREERAHQLEMRRQDKQLLEIQLMLQKARTEVSENNSDDTTSDKTVRVKARTPKLPTFNEGKDDLDAYLKRYERYATSQGWDHNDWAVNLSALLTGKALEVYSRLPTGEANDYKSLKSALLKRFQLTTDGFRLKLRTAKPETGESGHQFAARLDNYLTRWTDLAEIEETYEGLKDLLLREQFTDGCGRELALFLRERQPKSIGTMADIAEQYLEARGGMFGNPVSFRNTYSKYFNQTVKKPENTYNKVETRGSPAKSNSVTCFICHRIGHMAKDCRSSTLLKSTPPTCYRCQKTGHIARNCRQDTSKCAGLFTYNISDYRSNSTLPIGEQENLVLDNGNKSSASDSRERFETVACMITKRVAFPDSCCVNNECDHVTLKCGHSLPIMSAACSDSLAKKMPVSSGMVGPHRVSVLRDSGCSGVVVRRKLVHQEQMTGKEKTCVLIDGTVRNLPVAQINVNTPFFSGSTQALCMDNPIYDLILGNITGVRAPEDPDESWMTLPSPSCAVQTRSQVKNQDKPFRSLKIPKTMREIVTAEKLKTAQQEDPTLQRVRALAENKAEKVSCNEAVTSFYYQNGFLYRRFCSPSVEHGNGFDQLVVPKLYRQQVMHQAHETLFGGHQGSKKTTDKVLTNFFWPGITADITRYCRSCDVCQRTVPRGRITKVPLGSMPLIDTPFERIAVDIVGPIHPMSNNRNRYILTIIDFATRYPEAIPLPSIEAERVAEALVSVFTRIGIPKEMLTDRGSQFTSEIMKQVSKLLSIRQLMTSPYHPACNGLVERFNGSLKQMLKRMCAERPADWDRYLDPLLFAIRESPQESLGFSPFELLYGRKVRGPMSVMRELWTGEVDTAETKTTYQYIIDLKERLNETCEAAQKELQKSKVRYKHHYDKKSRPRQFEVDNKVLLLLPTDKNKLLLQWKGPFSITAKVGTLDYRININGKMKVFHINLLKRYYERPKEVEAAMALDPSEIPECVLDLVCTSVIESDYEHAAESQSSFHMSNENLLQLHPLQAKESIADIHIDPSLDESHRAEVNRLIGNYKDILTDLPGQTTLGHHEIKLKKVEPIRSKPYPLPHALRDTVKEEVSTMLNMGIIEPSNAPFASPIVLVKKPDGSNRFCVDYRKINQLTLFDAEPIPDQEELFTRLAHDHYFTKIDLSKGYWQVPMEESSKPLTSFITPDGLFQFKVMPFGLVNAPATFSRIMRRLLHKMDNVVNYIDDILIHTSSWEQHMNALKELFRRLRSANLTARPSKCFIGCDTIEFLGHVVGKGHFQPRPEKVQNILQAKRPETKKQLRSFLGMTNYYRRFIPNYSAIACPLTDKTKNKEPNRVCWEISQEKAFNTLKVKLTSAPILCLPDLTKQFILRTDASEAGIGAVLLQIHEGEKFPVAYASKKLLPREKTYSVMEKECLAIIWSLRKFEPYLYGREFTIETDHQPLIFIQRAKVANGRIMRWALALQPYRFHIEAIKGSDNVGADYLSRSSVELPKVSQ